MHKCSLMPRTGQPSGDNQPRLRAQPRSQASGQILGAIFPVAKLAWLGMLVTFTEAGFAAVPGILEILLCPVLNEPGRDRSNRCARRVNVADSPEHRPQDPARLARCRSADINLDDLAARLPRSAYQEVLTRTQ